MREKLGLAVIHKLLADAEKNRRESRIEYLKENHDAAKGLLILANHSDRIEPLGLLEHALLKLSDMLFPDRPIKRGFFWKWQEIAVIEKLAVFCAFTGADLAYSPNKRPISSRDEEEVNDMYMLVWHFRNLLDKNRVSGNAAIGGLVTWASADARVCQHDRWYLIRKDRKESVVIN